MDFDNISPSLASEVLEELDLAGLRVVANAADVARMQQSSGCAVAFPEALRQALQAFLNNRQGSSEAGNDSPCGLIFDVPEAHGLPPNPDGQQVAQVLRSYLKKDSDAAVVLLTQATIQEDRYRFTPEYGEDIDANWVFRVLLPGTFDMLTWAIVDKTGEKTAYAYCIE